MTLKEFIEQDYEQQTNVNYLSLSPNKELRELLIQSLGGRKPSDYIELPMGTLIDIVLETFSEYEKINALIPSFESTKEIAHQQELKIAYKQMHNQITNEHNKLINGL